jgi:4'-phosphopantetheinyl transferase EntD
MAAATAREEALETALATLFPPGTGIAACAIDAPQPDLFPEERPAVATAVPSRRAEFAAGRAAARLALAAIGQPATALPSGPQRQPLWPAGIAGSIAHAAGFAIAVARRGAPLGVDIEEDAPISPDLWPLICQPDELAALPLGDRGTYVRHVFSAKEAIYKAQFPMTGAVIGFDAVELRLTPGGFTAHIRQTLSVFRAGHRIEGRRIATAGLILTGVSL